MAAKPTNAKPAFLSDAQELTTIAAAHMHAMHDDVTSEPRIQTTFSKIAGFEWPLSHDASGSIGRTTQNWLKTLLSNQDRKSPVSMTDSSNTTSALSIHRQSSLTLLTWLGEIRPSKPEEVSPPLIYVSELV